MTWRCFMVLFAAFALIFIAFMVFVEYQTDAFDGWHYSVDTITLRARLSDPDDEKIKNPVLFKTVEDIVSILVFVLLGFGLAVYQKSLEAAVALREYELEKTKPVEKQPAELADRPERPKPKSWREWLKERDPKMYAELYGDRPDKAAMRWMLNLPPKQTGDSLNE